MAPEIVKDSASTGTDPNIVRQEQQNAAKKCADVIKFQHNGQLYDDKQDARVTPNERLITVFGINNAFTNRDKQAKDKFTKDMETLMKSAMKIHGRKDQDDWSGLRKQALLYFDHYLVQKKEKTIKLAELTQYITLELSLFFLFPDAYGFDGSKRRFEDVLVIGHAINRLWIDSKERKLERPKWEDQIELRAALQRVTTARAPTIPGAWDSMDSEDASESDSENALNSLLPAYETMWRVVMRGYLEIQYRNAPEGPSWHTTMTEYLRALGKPTGTRDNAFYRESENGVRPIDIAKETLRLYPPTRRVHRVFDGETHKADIEACQRMNLLGDEPPLQFCPERWQSICVEDRNKLFGLETNNNQWASASRELKRKEEELGYMPFASWCAADHPEAREFGMKMVALLIAVLCEKLGSEWALENGGSMPEREVPLATDRKAYENLRLKKI